MKSGDLGRVADGIMVCKRGERTKCLMVEVFGVHFKYERFTIFL